MKRTEKKKKEKRQISLRTYLIVSFVLFSCLALFVTWIFQVFLLDNVFEYVKKRELKNASEELCKVLGTDQLESVLQKEAIDGLMSIEIYRMDGKEAFPVASGNATVGGTDDFGFIPPKKMLEFYDLAKNNEGIYETKVVSGGREIPDHGVRDLFISGKDREVNEEKTLNLVRVQLYEDAYGNEYLLCLRSSAIPLNTTYHTLRRQFFWIAVILFFTVVLITVPMSKRIAKPLRQMNEEAKRLAKGNYDVHFKGSGYRETENLAESLDFAASELAKTDQMQKELIANISHDLRTPLTMIRCYGEAMRDIPGENSPENVQVIIDETERLSLLVSDLLDLSKIQSGIRSPEPELFDLTLAVRETIGRYGVLIKNQGYRILLKAENDVPVLADRGMILQVLYNLINNALNYAGDDRTVVVRQSLLNGTVRVDVIDHGEGIAKDQIPLIWDRYYKVDKVHRMAMVGTGLGLSIVKGILEAHAARYGVESVVGEGSDFWFELPVATLPESDENQKIL